MFFLVFGQFVVNQYKNYGIKFPEINDDTFLTLVGSLSSVCNGLSRIFWASLYDKLGFKPIFFTAGVLQVRKDFLMIINE